MGKIFSCNCFCYLTDSIFTGKLNKVRKTEDDVLMNLFFTFNLGSMEEIITIKLLNLEHGYYHRYFHFVF